MSFEEMRTILDKYVEEYWGQEWAEEIWNGLCSIWDGDVETMNRLYEKYKYIVAAP